MKRRTAFLLVIAMLLSLLSCSEQSADKSANQDSPLRVAALSGSLADMWLLAGGEIAAATDDAFEDLGLSQTVVNVGSLKNPNVELLISAEIDLVIMNSAIEGQRAIAETLEKSGMDVRLYDIESFWDYLWVLEELCDITNNSEAYQKYGLDLKKKIETIIDSRLLSSANPPRVLLIRAFSSGAKAKNSQNNMTGMMLAELGCVNIADSEGSLLENLSMEVVVEEDPEYIFVTTMGSSSEALAALSQNIKSNPAWKSLTAVKEGRYYELDPELFHEKPNERWAESYARLAQILYGYEVDNA
ncbi:MAG: ABC transporter substrate-binding protein [Clostridia bacterium]|nr:ABC transporter substrate-binding protein [Clostridia bacterium]